MPDTDWPEPKVTGNAVLLSGYLAGAAHDDYKVVDAKAEDAVIILETRRTGNRFAVTVAQIGGIE